MSRCLNCEIAIPSVEDFCSLLCQNTYNKYEEAKMSGDWKPGSKTTRDPALDYNPTTGLEAAAAKAASQVGVIVDREVDCLAKAKERGQLTFTLVEQDYSSPTVIVEWIKANIETCPKEKLFEALDKAIRMRDTKIKRKDPD